MNAVTEALTLSDTAPRSTVAIVYGLLGLAVGAMFLGNK